MTTRIGESYADNGQLEAALTAADITVFAQDRDLRYLWILNPRLGISKEEVVGKTDRDVLPIEKLDELIAIKKQAMSSGEKQHTWLAIENGSAGLSYFSLSIIPTKTAGGEISGVLCIAIDRTDEKENEAKIFYMSQVLAESHTRLSMAIENSNITVFEQDQQLVYTAIVNAPVGLASDDFIGRSDADLLSTEDQLKIVPAKRRVLAGGPREKFAVSITLDGWERHYDVMLDGRKNTSGETIGLIGTAVDLTDRRKEEQQLRLVMRELTHRSKNLLAVIQAIARQTASKSDNTENFVSTFTARLQAMAASHDLLVTHTWFGADLGELVLAHLGQVMQPSSSRIEIEGPDVKVNADTAQNLGLALHELTTNAAKHGAFTNGTGQVKVNWSVKNGSVQMLWQETDGPEVHPPARRGFGRLLLERSVGPSLGGSVALDFAPAGLLCTIAFPVERLVGQ